MDIEKIKKQIIWEEKLNRNPNLVKQRIVAAVLIISAIVGGIYYWQERSERLREEMLVEAQAALKGRSYERSVEIMERLVLEYPDYQGLSRVLLHLAETYDVFLNENQKALYNYLLIVKDHQQSEEYQRAMEEVARLYKYELKNYGEALVVYQKLLDKGGNSADHYQYEVADCYFSLNNFEQARIELENLIQHYPETEILAEATFRIGMIHYLEESFAEADAKFDTVISTWPESGFAIEAHYFKAGILEDQERLVEALDQYETIRTSYPNPEVIEKKIEQVTGRISKKKKAI